MESSSVCKLYNGAAVFVTGGTGFLGNLLIEKLVRTCPNVLIYILMRPKKGKNEKERYEELFEGNLFDSMKEACPDNRNKIKYVLGDIGLPKLGLSEEDRIMLMREVSIVFHIATTVRFDEKIRSAVHINVRGTKEMLELAKNMTQLKVSKEKMESSSVCKLYNGAAVFVTGGTGFLGNLLIEKLVRTCPNVLIYILMRPKKGKNEKERYEELFEGNLFDSMKEACPDNRNKIKYVLGDIGLPKLGLSEEDRIMLMREVSIVFHIATTVRFDEKIRSAVHINVRGTKEMLELAKNMTQLKAFIHVSSAYANCAYMQIDEKFYQPPVTSDEIMQLVDLLKEDLLTDMTPILLGKWPNTYVLTKAISEETVKEYGKDLPVAVVRPAVVICTAREPYPGWINNLYGPTGVVIGAGMGLLRTMHCDKHTLAEVVPADMVVNLMLVTAWNVATQHRTNKAKDIPVFNYISSTQNPITWEEYMKYNECGKEYPTTNVLWYYCLSLHKNRIIHTICVIFLHYLPALIVDTGLCLMGKKPMLWNAYKKIHKFIGVLSYFSLQQWKFTDNNVQELWKRTSPVDQQLFDFNIGGIDWPIVFRAGMQNLRVFLVNETADSLPLARKRYRRLKIAHYTLVYTLWILLFIFLSWIIASVMT